MKTLLLSLFLVVQILSTGLEITVVGAAQKPIEGLHFILNTYIYEKGVAILRETVECDTDAEGACTLLLEKPNQEGMQRATLQIGDHGSRDLLWPGGVMKLVIPLEQIGFGREAAPYEFQAEDGGVTVRKRGFPLYVVLMVLLLVLIFWLISLYAKSQEGRNEK